jgi:hypothetical protein
MFQSYVTELRMAARRASEAEERKKRSLEEETSYFNSEEGRRERELEYAVLDAEAMKRKISLEGRKKMVTRKERKREEEVLKRGAEAMVSLEQLRKKREAERSERSAKKEKVKISFFSMFVFDVEVIEWVIS